MVILKKRTNDLQKIKQNVNKVSFDGSHSDVMHVSWEAELRPCSGVRLP